MLSAYFKLKTKTDDFKNHIKDITDKCKDKKVLLYGANDNFIILNKKHSLAKQLDITAIVDEKLSSGRKSVFCGIKSISKNDIKNEQFDIIIITNENPQQIIAALEAEYEIKQNMTCSLLEETIPEERKNINLLFKHKFDKTYPRLVRKMKNKKVVLYGAGIFLETINKYFDLSKLNIIGIADKKYSLIDNQETFLGYKTYNPAEIKDLNPDYVLISTKLYISIFEYLHFNLLHGTKIKVKPLVQKSFFALLKEVIES